MRSPSSSPRRCASRASSAGSEAGGAGSGGGAHRGQAGWRDHSLGESTAQGLSHWSTREMAADVDVSAATIHRLWEALQPHRTRFRFAEPLLVRFATRLGSAPCSFTQQRQSSRCPMKDRHPLGRRSFIVNSLHPTRPSGAARGASPLLQWLPGRQQPNNARLDRISKYAYTAGRFRNDVAARRRLHVHYARRCDFKTGRVPRRKGHGIAG